MGRLVWLERRRRVEDEVRDEWEVRCREGCVGGINLLPCGPVVSVEEADDTT